MRTVYKYDLTPETLLRIPADAKPLHVATQRGAPCMWVELRTDAPVVDRNFIVAGTGHRLPEMANLDYIGTAHNVEGVGLVFHVFEVLQC